MKKQIFKISLILSCMLASCTNNKETLPTMSLTWEMGANNVVPGMYENTFFIVNNGARPLQGNWIVYYNQQQYGRAVQEENPQVKVEQISANYYKMYPTSAYRPVQPGDSLKVTFRCPGSIINFSMAPDGAYMVTLDARGNQSKPESVAITYMPFTREEQWSRPGTPELPYPWGDLVYDETLPFAQPAQLRVTDIFPSPKTVNFAQRGELIFTRDVHFVHDPIFENEAMLLEDELEKMYGCRCGLDADVQPTTVELTLLPVGFVPRNDEHYLLDVRDGKVTIAGATPHAVFNGTKTLLGILGAVDLPVAVPYMHISDYPDLAYRGQMIDVSRNFTSKENIFRIIDLLSMYKMSRLHLQLTDDEGWRIEIPGLEELTEIGARRGHTLDESECIFPAYGSGWDYNDPTSLGNGYFTRSDFIEILQYATRRHIKVIPEIDFPGHSRAAIKAMNVRYHRNIDNNPAKATEFLLTDFADSSRYVSAQGYSDNTLNAGMPSVYRFIEKVVDEMVSMYRDAGLKLEILHMGGDEIPHGVWVGSPVAQVYMQQENIPDIQGLTDYFWRRTLAILREREIQPAGWQEISLRGETEVNPEFVNENTLSYCWNTIPEWNGDQIPYMIANAGYPIILCNVSNFYMDFTYGKHPQETGHYWGGFLNEVNSFNMLPYRIYLSVRRYLSGAPKDIYEAEREKLPLNPAARQQIKGVQGQLWAETIRHYGMIEYSLFPKMYGLIERGWNAQPAWSLTNNEDAYVEALKLYRSKISERELPRLAKLGVNFRVMHPGIKIIDGMLYANSVIPGATIRYTVDGSEPTAESPVWTAPVRSDANTVKAKAFYHGRESVTTILR